MTNGEEKGPDAASFLEKMATHGFEYLMTGGGLLLFFWGLFGNASANIGSTELLLVAGLGGIGTIGGLLAFFLKNVVYFETRKQEIILNQVQETQATLREQINAIKQIGTRSNTAAPR